MSKVEIESSSGPTLKGFTTKKSARRLGYRCNITSHLSRGWRRVSWKLLEDSPRGKEAPHRSLAAFNEPRSIDPPGSLDPSLWEIPGKFEEFLDACFPQKGQDSILKRLDNEAPGWTIVGTNCTDANGPSSIAHCGPRMQIKIGPARIPNVICEEARQPVAGKCITRPISRALRIIVDAFRIPSIPPTKWDQTQNPKNPRVSRARGRHFSALEEDQQVVLEEWGASVCMPATGLADRGAAKVVGTRDKAGGGFQASRPRSSVG
ncbi:hypothetical protein KM043_001036 [Ampulex compressa]|nr:hypothetical protein KM043_001036 [Ampulex compressa]